MEFKEILIWLVVFIVGSLIVSWIINGNMENKIYEIKNSYATKYYEKNTNLQINTNNLIRIPVSIFEYNQTCPQIESLSSSNGISKSQGKENMCLYICANSGQGSLYLDHYSCEENNNLICYCKN